MGRVEVRSFEGSGAVHCGGMAPWPQNLKEKLLAAIPPESRQDLVDVKNALWGRYRHTHYAQSGEDIVIAKLFPEKRGYFVDVGANHPFRYSNTYLLYVRGWRGLNIDPYAKAIKLFTRVRPRDTSVVLGIAQEETTLPYYQFADPAFNTFSLEAAEAARKRIWLKELPTTSVPVRPLAEVLRTYVPAGTVIDFLTIDTEGYDLEVLKSNNWEEFLPRVIAVEDHTFDPNMPSDSETYRFLHDRGYTLYAYTGLTLIFTLKT